jgi:hypothetical protein
MLIACSIISRRQHRVRSMTLVLVSWVRLYFTRTRIYAGSHWRELAAPAISDARAIGALEST